MSRNQSITESIFNNVDRLRETISVYSRLSTIGRYFVNEQSVTRRHSLPLLCEYGIQKTSSNPGVDEFISLSLSRLPNLYLPLAFDWTENCVYGVGRERFGLSPIIWVTGVRIPPSFSEAFRGRSQVDFFLQVCDKDSVFQRLGKRSLSNGLLGAKG